jgi:hypothetical protein
LFGKWNTVFKRYRDWVKADVFKRLFDASSEDPDLEYAMVDALNRSGFVGGSNFQIGWSPYEQDDEQILP